MHFVVIGKDEPSGQMRRQHRAAHLVFVAGRQHEIIYAGPLLEGERMIGSLFVFDVPDRAALDAYLTSDPYFAEEIFQSVEIFESRWMVPEREPGYLTQETERAQIAAASER
jgi:hypothetical protein